MSPTTGHDASVVADAGAAAPDWQSVSADVLCPLCDYNLRGLEQPRCPECGHRFDWLDLLDRSRWEHPWLFEHRRKRKIRSFVHTFLAGLLPGKFWKSVQPIHRPNPRKLFFYWLILGGLLGVVLMLLLAVPVAREYVSQRTWRQEMVYLLNSRPNDPRVAPLLRVYRTPQAAAAAIAPMPTWDEIVSRAAGKYRGLLAILAPLSLMYLAWPWLTVFALMIFRSTMDEARIKPEHVIRCAIYSFDSAILLGGVLFAMLVWEPLGDYGFRMWPYVLPLANPSILFVLMLAAALLTLKLSIAYRMYLRFPNAIVTCLLAQLVVCLAILTVYMTISMW